MRIAIDLDSTLNSLDQTWLDLYNRDYDDHLAPDDIHSWDTHLYVKPECGKKIYQYLNSAQLYTLCTPRPHAQEIVERWLAAGHDLIVVSSCTPNSYAAKLQWLAEHFPGIAKDNFIACHRKSLIRAAALIDDRFDNLRDFRGRRILLKAAWNVAQHAQEGRSLGIDLAADWLAIADLLAYPDLEEAKRASRAMYAGLL